ncbi:MAG: type II secretion system F family protein [Gemmatimonadaceae bacterium]
MSFTVLGALRDLDESRHRAELYRAWGIGLAAGLAPHVVLDQMGRIAFPSVDEARRYLVVGAGQGKSVTTLVKARPKLFAPFEGAVLVAGDESGALSQSLRLLTDYFSGDFKRCLAVRNALGYPIFVGLVAAFGLPFVLLPKSPVKTYALAIVVLLAAFLLLGGVFLSVLAAVSLNTNSLTRARFARVLAMTLEAGIPLGRAVRLSVDASGNRGLSEQIKKRSERELNTTPLAKLFEGCEQVPAALLGQMMVADATGDYKATLSVYAASLEQRER